LFDKKLRLLMLDAIERIEIHIRSVIAHELGYHNPLAYQDSSFIRPKECKTWIDRHQKTRNNWKEWKNRHNKLIYRSREDCILWHLKNSKEMPIWVVVEAWDFGTTSKYFGLLKGKYQNKICARLSISNAKVLKNWL
jgi:abortive infection bacteriophage resistance protein